VTTCLKKRCNKRRQYYRYKEGESQEHSKAGGEVLALIRRCLGEKGVSRPTGKKRRTGSRFGKREFAGRVLKVPQAGKASRERFGKRRDTSRNSAIDKRICCRKGKGRGTPGHLGEEQGYEGAVGERTGNSSGCKRHDYAFVRSVRARKRGNKYLLGCSGEQAWLCGGEEGGARLGDEKELCLVSPEVGFYVLHEREGGRHELKGGSMRFQGRGEKKKP